MAFYSVFGEDGDIMMDRLKKLNRCPSTLESLLELAQELDQYEEDLVTEALLRRILNVFESTHPRPEVEMGVGTTEDRRKFLQVIEEVNKGVIYQGLRERIRKYVKDHSDKGTSLNEYLYLFSKYFKVRFVGTHYHWEVVLDEEEMCMEVESEEIAVQEVEPRVQLQQYVASHGSKIEFSKESGQTKVSLLGQSKLVPNGRIFEDDAVQSLLDNAEETQRVPFKQVLGGPVRGKGQLKLMKTHQFEAMVQVVEGDAGKLMIMDRAEELVVDYDLRERESVIIQAGDGRVQRTLKFFGDQKGQKKKIRGKIKDARLVYSTDQSAERRSELGRVEVVHASGALVIQLHKDFPEPRMLCPLNVSLSWYANRKPWEPLAADAEGLEKMFFTVLQMRRRKIMELDFLLNITYHPHVPAIGKYLCSVGAKRVDEGGEIWWCFDRRQRERIWLIWEHVFYQEPLPEDERVRDQIPFFLESIPACLPLIQPLAHRNHVRAVRKIELAYTWSDDIMLELAKDNMINKLEVEERNKMNAKRQKES